ncbi:E3 ubiquitin-protein ligase SHPRH isoform X2 [Engraulis encrasicolus]|uniref:E3 ubiquitin-protein ligase SHPRH isoform X2 n=1 Tax=Engraulis encrasicolus TaxID=184585 RepID=UPI002FCF7DAC
MSSKRKRAPPVKVDDEAKKKLNWNMHEDRRNEVDLELLTENSELIADCIPVATDEPSCSKSCLSLPDSPRADKSCVGFSDISVAHKDTSNIGIYRPGNELCFEQGSPSRSTLSDSVVLNLATSTPELDGVWCALIGEFNLRVHFPPELENIQEWAIQRTDGGRMCLCVSGAGDAGDGDVEEAESLECKYPVEGSLGRVELEEFDWLQKRKIIQLSLRLEEEYVKLSVYLLEAGLSHPEFLSEGSGRMKKSNQLIQKLMEHFYDFIIPEVAEDEDEDGDTELERQNVEELYDSLRLQHQREEQGEALDVQHEALVPVLRLYQSQAVNWMLRREKYSSTASQQEPSLHFLWREIVSLCGKKLYYNIYTGCLVLEFPQAGPYWPGGILADEMGLGKTVEVLALILFHSRQGLENTAPCLPEGVKVNYFQPPPPLEKQNGVPRKPRPEPKERISYPAVRVMILTAIKEMKVGRGASINAIFAYMRSWFRYDPIKNRSHIKKTLAKLISEELVEQVKGRGLAGSFKFGKKYKESKKKTPCKQKPQSSIEDITPRRTSLRRSTQEKQTSLTSDLLDSDLDSESDTTVPLPEAEDIKQESDLTCHPPSSIPSAESTEKHRPEEKKQEEEEEEKEQVESSAELEEKADSQPQDKEEGSGPPCLEEVKDITQASSVPEPEYHFECICGETGLLDYKARVQCLHCLLWQHAHCVNYAADSLDTTPFYCPHCVVAMPPVPTRATLIISPSSICHQWGEEINRHIRSASLRVLVYQGVKRHGFIQPHVLAEQDVVITTYDVLRSELNYVDLPHSNSQDGRRFRTHKRYMAVPSPLVAVEWWRVCLDEAQMVECTTAKAAEMALRLSSVNRWCVSGTPVQRGLEDLYGLVLFLGVDPYWVKHWWEQLLYRPYRRGNPDPLYSLMGRLLWRSAKKDVIDQIQIPPQTEEIHWLRFSPVENHFYQRQHEVCSQDALHKLRKISDWSLRLSSLDRRTVTTILCPLLRLRQACCHPQAVRGEFLPFQKSTMTMEELLKSLQKKCRVECEEAHRQLVCALNGLAGIHIIRDEFVEAAEMYREVLRSSEEHKGKLKTDSLQRLHATHNLMELLNAKHEGIPPTLRDDRLKEEAEQLRQHYMTKSNSEVSEGQQNLHPVVQNIKELKRKVNLRSPWWMDVIAQAMEYSMDDELVQRVQNELTCSYKQEQSKLSMADKFRDARGLQFLLTTQMDDLLKSQKVVQNAVQRLEGTPSQAVIEEATLCHLRPVRLPLQNCVFCKADELFTDYESKLFSHTVKGQTAIFEEMIENEEGLVDDRLPTTSRGLWAASETERTLKAMLAFARARRLDAQLLEEASAFMELFEAWKKEYKVLHEYWMNLRDHVSAIDELGMATERLRVRLPDEPKQKVLHIIEPHEVDQNCVKLINDRAVARSQLQKKLGQLLYLTNLEKSQDKSTGGLNPEPCPICARSLGQEWAVLTCGHCFCNECITIIMEQYSVGSRRRAIKCAICRQTTSHTDISYVFTAQNSADGDDIPIKGSHSTKVEAVVRVLKKIQMTDPGAKSLVFSTWQGVLDIIAKALFDNNMEFSQINGIQMFQKNLCAFKYEEKINILLMPLHTGSNGLNIIEATHVLLVEPILNPAHQLQAIGRVHRIGQTKPTFVHRFLIRSTIEEKMQAMLKTVEKSHVPTNMKHSEASVFTVADLAELFTEETEDRESLED